MTDLTEFVRRGQPLPLEGIVDMHAHVGEWGRFPMPGRGVDAMVRQMDLAGVEKMIVAHEACMTPNVEYGNDHVIAAMRKHPDRILGFATAYPAVPRLGLDEIRRCFDLGMCAMKLHTGAGVPYSSPLYDGIWRFADERHMPVLIHADPDPKEWEHILSRYRDIMLLLGHAGASRPELFVECAKKYDNAVLDLASSVSRFGLVEYFVKEVGAERVVFGTDMPWMAVTQQIGRVVFADITEDQKRMILVENAARILERVRR